MRTGHLIGTSVVLLMLTGSCGPAATPESTVKDEVDPTGEHEYHYFGKVRFVYNDTRRFPDAHASSYAIAAPLVSGRMDISVPTSDIPASGQAIESSVKVLKGRQVGVVYRPEYNSFGVAEQIPTSQDFVIEVKTKRIDVNDMLITRQDGSTYYRQGTYRVDVMKGNSSSYILLSEKTKTGLDVPVGYKYNVEVTAVTEEGITKKQAFILDYTHR